MTLAGIFETFIERGPHYEYQIWSRPLITEELQKMFTEFQKETTHKVLFYFRDQQFWFKNSTTGREYPVPIALIDRIMKSDDKSEVHRVARRDFKNYFESTHFSKVSS